ncbi:MAG: hypothetical protein FWD58_05750 [Firmicutes bacterium]|nr:hypothetical protein [Bacillota bacterium]
MEQKLRTPARQISGVTLYNDRLCEKVKQEFRDYVGMGMSVADAEELLTTFFEWAEGEPYDKAVCYLALADTEWHAGRLSEHIKQKALEILDSGLAQGPWEEACRIPKEERSGFFDVLMEGGGMSHSMPFGFCYEQAADKQGEDFFRDMIKVAAEVPDHQEISLSVPQRNYSSNIKHIFALDKSPDKKLQMRRAVLEELKARLLSPQPPPKKFPRPKFAYPSDFTEGEVLVFRVPEGEYEGHYYAFQVMARKMQRHFSSSDYGLYYYPYGALYDYFSPELPDLEALKSRGLKTVEINKNNGKIYYRTVLWLCCNERDVENHLAARFFNDGFTQFREMQEALCKLQSGGFGWSAMYADGKDAAKLLTTEAKFHDYDATDEEAAADEKTQAEKIADKNRAIVEAGAHLYGKTDMTYEDFNALDEEEFVVLAPAELDLSGGIITCTEIDRFFASYGQIEKLTVFGLRQDTFEYFIKSYGANIKCLNLARCKLVEDFSALGTLENLVYFSAEWNQRVTKLWDMSRNRSLLGLGLGGFTRLGSLEGIQSAPALKHFGIGSFGMHSDGCALKSLSPLVGTRLESFGFGTTAIEEKDIDIYSKIKTLKRLDFHPRFYTTEEIAYIVARNPHLCGDSLRAHQPWGDSVFISGTRKPRLDPKKDAARIQKYQAQFDKLVALCKENK